jgi:predicted DCC family thiol-disulfide oxidoreductase YuxK
MWRSDTIPKANREEHLMDHREMTSENPERNSPPPAGKSVVLYDGQCNFCLGQIANLRRIDIFKSLDFISLHDPQVTASYPDLTFEQLMREMWVVAPSQKRYSGAYALRYLTRILPLLWPLAPAMHFPGLMPLWSWLYREVAKRRYRIAGRDCTQGTCSIHAGREIPSGGPPPSANS